MHETCAVRLRYVCWSIYAHEWVGHEWAGQPKGETGLYPRDRTTVGEQGETGHKACP